LAYQERLRKLGYLTTEPDGTFGEDTKAAVKLFQESSGLIADGYIGPTTKAALMSDDAQGNALAIGAKGETVQRVQERLKALGYTRKVTGYFGSDTDAAVKNFQSTNKLKVDGKVGAQTMNTLMSDSAKKYKKPSSSGGGSSNNGGSSDNGGGGGSSANISGANVDSFISVAESKIGSKYVRGAKGPNSFDCSGFVYWCLNQVGVNQSYMTSGSWAKSSKYTKIDNMGDMQRGDIIVFKGHVAIYAGSGVMIDASSSNGKVVKRGSTGSWSQRSFICAFRVF
jgi:peptidoglycan hydrolase-like protein with peptidoglycan-binding domain